ncbi:MAG: NifB/NifX family molybdenum-iron cluster-binding protein [bacterium]
MTICITTDANGDGAKVDPRFGRAPFFTFVDTESGASRVVANVYASGASGVGAQVAQMIAEHGAEAVVTGQVGPSAFRVLEAAGVTVYTSPAVPVAEAVESHRTGTLEQAGGATGPGHQGVGRS